METANSAFYVGPKNMRATTPAGRSYQLVVAALYASLQPLNSADKNRVLLALHLMIADELEALSISTHV
jgi:hypothetical protein